jgi:hypothetical protein
MATQEESKNTGSENEKKSLLQIAEVRMVLYVVPLAILFAIIGYILSQSR